jgi:ankyrin repeat protein
MGQRELTELILELGEDNVNAQDIDGWSPLLVAVNWRRSSVVQLLLKQATIDSNLANYDGWTCLHLAMQAGNAEMVDLLLQSPATDPRKRLPDGRTPIDLAKHHGFDAMAKDLREQLKRIVRREHAIGKSSAMAGEKDQDS